MSKQPKQKKITVPDDYPLIQDAIDGAADGDTIFVRSGVYYEMLVIDKSLTLIGEDREHTIIDAHKITEDVVHIIGSGVTFTNFTLGHTGYIYSSGSTPPSGIHVETSNNNITRNTIVSVHGPAFKIEMGTSDNIVQNNIMANCSDEAFDGLFYTRLAGNEVIEYTNFPSPFPADISLLEGNEILEVSRTKGASFGKLILKDNATLLVDNFEAKADTLQATDNSQIILVNGAYLYVHQVTGASLMVIYLLDSASINSKDSRTVNIVCRNDSQVCARNSKLSIRASGNASVELNNCNGRIQASDKANITTTNGSHDLDGISGEACVWASNSYLHGDAYSFRLEDKSTLWLANSTARPYLGVAFQEETQVWIINSTFFNTRDMDFYNKSSVWVINSNLTYRDSATTMHFHSADARLIYGWYLNVNVKSPEGDPLENMNVEIYCSNGSLVEEGTTDSHGNAQFILANHIRRGRGDQYFVPYTVRAYGANFQGETTVDLDSNKEITLTTSIYAPPSSVPTTWVAAAVIIVIVVSIGLLVYFKKRNR